MSEVPSDEPQTNTPARLAGVESAGTESTSSRFECALLGCALVSTTLLIGVDGLEAGDQVYVPKRLVLGLLAALLVLQWPLSRQNPPGITATLLAWGGTLLVGLASVLMGSAPLQLGLERLAADSSALGVAASAARVAKHDEHRAHLVSLLTGVAALVATLALLEALGLELPWSEIRRPVATLGGRNQVAGFVALILPLAVARFASGTGFAWGISAFIMGTAVVLTRCRSVWLGIAIAAILAGVGLLRAPAPPDIRRRVSRVVFLFVLALGVATLTPWPGLRWKEPHPFLESLGRIAEYDRGSGHYRVEQARVTLAISSSSPLLGVGPTGWTDASARFAHTVGLHPPPYGDGRAPRSDLLRILAETGLLGIIAMLRLAWAVGQRVRADSHAVPGLGAALTVLAVHALFDQPLLRAEQLAAVGVLVGIAMVGERPIGLPVAVRRAAFAFLVMLIVGGTCSLGRYYLIATMGPTRDLVTTSHVEALSRAARRLTRSSDCNAAAPLLDRAIAEAPHLVGLLCLAASCAESRGDLPSAMEFARRADEVEPHLSYQLQRSSNHDCATVLRLLEAARPASP